MAQAYYPTASRIISGAHDSALDMNCEKQLNAEDVQEAYMEKRDL